MYNITSNYIFFSDVGNYLTFGVDHPFPAPGGDGEYGRRESGWGREFVAKLYQRGHQSSVTSSFYLYPFFTCGGGGATERKREGPPH